MSAVWETHDSTTKRKKKSSRTRIRNLQELLILKTPEWRGMTRCGVVLLPTLSGWAPTRVFLSCVLGASRTRQSSVQKRRKALFFDPRMERCALLLWSPRSSARRWAGLLSRASSEGEGQSSHQARAAVLLRLRSAGPGAASLPAAAILSCVWWAALLHTVRS